LGAGRTEFAIRKHKQKKCFSGGKGTEPWAESEIWRVLIRNRRLDQTWTEYENQAQGDDGYPYFSTSDDKIYARLAPSGIWLEIAYKSYIERHRLFKKSGGATTSSGWDQL
jgi:hypothetical protein